MKRTILLLIACFTLVGCDYDFCPCCHTYHLNPCTWPCNLHHNDCHNPSSHHSYNDCYAVPNICYSQWEVTHITDTDGMVQIVDNMTYIFDFDHTCPGRMTKLTVVKDTDGTIIQCIDYSNNEYTYTSHPEYINIKIDGVLTYKIHIKKSDDVYAVIEEVYGYHNKHPKQYEVRRNHYNDYVDINEYL